MHGVRNAVTLEPALSRCKVKAICPQVIHALLTAVQGQVACQRPGLHLCVSNPTMPTSA